MNLVIPIVVVCLVIAALWYVMVLHRGKQSLSNAILLDDLEKFSRLIPNITQYDNKHRKEPSLLIRAADRNAVSILSFLIDKKVDVNAKDTNRLTPLMYAAQNNGNDKQFLCIKRLLSAGADINARDNNGRTALMYAAAHAAHPKLLIPLLLAHGADVHAVDEYGMTAPKYCIILELAIKNTSCVMKLKSEISFVPQEMMMSALRGSIIPLSSVPC